jgi:hypothetical protein
MESLERRFLLFAADFFSKPLQLLTRKTRIDHLTDDLHAPVIFSFEVEKQFGVEIDDDEAARLRTLGDYIRIVKSHLAGTATFENGTRKAA